ncbi:MAG TPA: hypothetical protein VN258_00875 [Mobilitalea sp.]|nr:hypothetical protein [Mobilitalea sp.]
MEIIIDRDIVTKAFKLWTYILILVFIQNQGTGEMDADFIKEK